MTIVYIIFTLICILLILAITFGILLYKQIKERLNYYNDIAEFIEFDDCLLNKSVIENIVKHDKNIVITTNGDSNNYVEKFNSEEECNNRYLDILDCILYYPKILT